jgi:hypothetical protein
MAQTTGAISSGKFKAEVSIDGTTWTDVSGSATTVSIDGGDVKVGSQHTAEGSEAIVVTSNKVDPRTVTVKSVYTEETGEAFAVVWARYAGSDKTIYVRWSPNGGATGDFRYTCEVGGTAAAVPIVSCTLPEHDASSEDVSLFEFSVMTPGVLKETVGT